MGIALDPSGTRREFVVVDEILDCEGNCIELSGTASIGANDGRGNRGCRDTSVSTGFHWSYFQDVYAVDSEALLAL